MGTFETIWDEFNLECPWWVGVQWDSFIMLRPIVQKLLNIELKLSKKIQQNQN
jgi:hypothetical protein